MPIKQVDKGRLKKVIRHLRKAYKEIITWEGPWPQELREAEGMMFAAGVRLETLYEGKAGKGK